MVGLAGGRSGAMRNAQASANLYDRQQAPPLRWYLNDGATQTLAAPTILDTRVDPTKLRITRESNMLRSTMSFRESVKRRTSRTESPSDEFRFYKCSQYTPNLPLRPEQNLVRKTTAQL